MNNFAISIEEKDGVFVVIQTMNGTTRTTRYDALEVKAQSTVHYTVSGASCNGPRRLRITLVEGHEIVDDWSEATVQIGIADTVALNFASYVATDNVSKLKR